MVCISLSDGMSQVSTHTHTTGKICPFYSILYAHKCIQKNIKIYVFECKKASVCCAYHQTKCSTATTRNIYTETLKGIIISKTQQNYMISNLPKCQRQTNSVKIYIFYDIFRISFHSLWLQVIFSVLLCCSCCIAKNVYACVIYGTHTHTKYLTENDLFVNT